MLRYYCGKYSYFSVKNQKFRIILQSLSGLKIRNYVISYAVHWRGCRDEGISYTVHWGGCRDEGISYTVRWGGWRGEGISYTVRRRGWRDG